MNNPQMAAPSPGTGSVLPLTWRPRSFEDGLKRAEERGCVLTRSGAGKAKSHCPLPGHSTPDGHLSFWDDGDHMGIDCKGSRHCHSELLQFFEAASFTYPRDDAARPFSGKVEAVYPYTDESGKLLYEVVRRAGKKFSQRRPDGSGGYVYKLGDVRRVLYRLPEVVAAGRAGRRIYIVEGEKDVESLRAHGLAATTAAMGAGKWRPDYNRSLAGCHIVVVPDQDEEGLKHGEQVCHQLLPIAASLRTVHLADGNSLKVKDATDWLAAGGTAQELEAMADSAKLWQPVVDSPGATGDWRTRSSSLEELMAADFEPLSFLVDGLIPLPGTTNLGGRKKLGKSWLVLQLAQSVASGAPFLGRATTPGRVVYAALEDGERRVQDRLRKQGADPSLSITFLWELPKADSDDFGPCLRAILETEKPTLVIIDTLSALLGSKMNENDNAAMAAVHYQLHGLALEFNCAIVVVMHHGKRTHDDPGMDLRGASSAPGAADTNIGLYKVGDGACEVKAEGRDIAGVELRIKFDEILTWSWQCVGDARDLRRAAVEDEILEVLRSMGVPLTADELARELGKARPTVSAQLSRMSREGKLTRKPTVLGRGRPVVLYSCPTKPTTPTKTTLPNSTDTSTKLGQPICVGVVGDVGYVSDLSELWRCTCGSTDYWTRRDGERVCSRCHPNPAINSSQ